MVYHSHDNLPTKTTVLASKPSINRKRFDKLCRGSQNGRPIVRNAILPLSDKWLSLDTRPMDEQMIISQMSFIHFGQVDIWFRTSVDAMLLVWRTSAPQISRQPLLWRGLNQVQIFLLSRADCRHCDTFEPIFWSKGVTPCDNQYFTVLLLGVFWRNMIQVLKQDSTVVDLDSGNFGVVLATWNNDKR